MATKDLQRPNTLDPLNVLGLLGYSTAEPTDGTSKDDVKVKIAPHPFATGGERETKGVFREWWWMRASPAVRRRVKGLSWEWCRLGGKGPDFAVVETAGRPRGG